MEKSRDIAILKTMGTSTASIRRIFMLQGLIIGVAGTLAGTVGGDRDHLRARPLQADPRADRRLPDLLRAVHAAAARLRSSVDRGGAVHLLRRDDLSVAPGVEARSRPRRCGTSRWRSSKPPASTRATWSATAPLQVLRGLVARRRAGRDGRDRRRVGRRQEHAAARARRARRDRRRGGADRRRRPGRDARRRR